MPGAHGGGRGSGAVASVLVAPVKALLGTYAQVLLSRSRLAGALLLAATALDPPACGMGLVALLAAALSLRLLAIEATTLAEGPYGYNAVFVGLAVGHFFGATPAALILAATLGAVVVLVTAALLVTVARTWALPVLSVPFLIGCYLLLAAAPALGIAPRHESSPWVLPLIAAFDWRWAARPLSALGALIFVPRPEAGALVMAALLIHSRIAALVVAGVVAAAWPAWHADTLPAGLVAPLIFNCALTAMALAGGWFVPSVWSFAVAGLGAVCAALAAVTLFGPMSRAGLPLAILPFNIAVPLVLAAMRLRRRDAHPKSVDFASGSPEQNLRYFRTRTLRALDASSFVVRLPFRGEWLCTQGVDGQFTHRGPWRHAYDFEVVGVDGDLFAGDPRKLDSYHCYRLPVLACADGTVVRADNDVPDNVLGEVDVRRNWGNVVLLIHAPGVYSLVAHLARGSVAVTPGQVVRRGDVLGLCGNSGRSPRPHLHFQLQSTPVLGAPTLPARFENAIQGTDAAPHLQAAAEPREDELWRGLESDPTMGEFFVFPVGSTTPFRVDGRTEELTSEIDLLGRSLLRSSLGGVLYFARTRDQFTVLDVIAPRRSVLHALRAALSRVPLIADMSVGWRDHLPPGWGGRGVLAPLADVVAPFLPERGVQMHYRIHTLADDRLVLFGHAVRGDRDGVPVVSVRVELLRGVGPTQVLLSTRGRMTRAERVAPPARLRDQGTGTATAGASDGGARAGEGPHAGTQGRVLHLPVGGRASWPDRRDGA